MPNELPSDTIILGDCLEVMKGFPDESLDCVVTDPPYGLGQKEPTGEEIIAYLQGGQLDTGGDFMGKQWSVPSVAVWKECYRVLKPGGHLLSFGGTRTFDLISMGIRMAGFEDRDTIATHVGGVLSWMHCLSEDTEILVDGRWASVHESIEGRLALCYDTEHDNFTWQPVQRQHLYLYDGDVYHLLGDNTDHIVTPEHRCVVVREGRIRFQLARTLGKDAEVPVVQDLSGLLEAFPLPKPLPICTKQDVLPGMQRGLDQSSKEGCARQERRGNDNPPPVSPMRERLSTSEGHQQVLQPQMFDLVAKPSSKRAVASEGASPLRRLYRSSARPEFAEDVFRSMSEAPTSTAKNEETPGGTAGDGAADVCRMRQGVLQVQSLGQECQTIMLLQVLCQQGTGTGLGQTRPQGQCREDARGQGSMAGGHDRGEQPFLEGWGNLLQQTRKLRSDQVCSLSPGVPSYGSQGRLRDGTPSHGGSSSRASFAEAGSGPSLEPQPQGQPPGKLPPVCLEQGPQTIRASRFTQTNLARVQREHYRGIVWCPTVPTGAFVARRNGKVFITGNSQGFPKSLSVERAIREKGGTEEEAAKWKGHGTALKPSWEPILVFRKPLAGTVAANVLEHGTGGLNIDACRVKHSSPADFEKHKAMVDRIKEKGGSMANSWKNSSDLSGASDVKTEGRWPPNLVLCHAPECKQVGTKKITSVAHWTNNRGPNDIFKIPNTNPVDRGNPIADANGLETVDSWECVDGCPVKMLDEQSGNIGPSERAASNSPDYDSGPGGYHGAGGVRSPSNTYKDSGGASRFFPQFEGQGPPEAPFFYTGKATKSETTLDGEVENVHPTRKPLKLMDWLVRLVCPPKGLVLDPFCGSGTTCVAACQNGMKFIGIEKDSAYYEIARQRVGIILKERQEEDFGRDLADLTNEWPEE